MTIQAGELWVADIPFTAVPAVDNVSLVIATRQAAPGAETAPLPLAGRATGRSGDLIAVLGSEYDD